MHKLSTIAFILTLLNFPVRLPALAPLIDLGATEVPLINSSFESGLIGWINSGGTVRTPAVDEEVYPVPDGTAAFFAGAGNCHTEFTFNLLREISSLEEKTIYECVIDVYPLAGQEHRLYFRLLDSSTDFQEFALAAYRPPWNNEMETISLQPNAWNQVRITFCSADAPSYTGLPFYIQIQGCGLAVDDVRLYKLPLTTSPGNTDYYISESMGDDANNGLTSGTPWQTFGPIRTTYFSPGDRVMLKRGDTWTEEMEIRGLGVAELPMTLTTYGTGERPHIILGDKEKGRAITVQNASHWRIDGLSASEAKLGLYLRYFLSYDNQDVLVEDCLFRDMDIWTVETQNTNFEVSFNAGMFVGGRVGGNDQTRTVLSGLTVRNCGFENCTAGFLTGWYFPELIYNRVTDLLIEDSYATRVSAGGLMLNSVENAVVRRFRTLEPCGQDGDFIWGSTGGIISSSRNILIEDCEFSETDRMWSDNQAGDGCGLDIDGRNVNVTVRDTVFNNNDAPGLLFLSTFNELNSNILIEDCVMYNNGLDGAVTFGGNAWEIKVPGSTLNGATFRNLGLYRSDGSWGWIQESQPAQFTAENLRYQWYSTDAASRAAPLWDFESAGNFAGWAGFNDWNGAAVTGGALVGTSAGMDPFVQSPPVWINTHRTLALRIEMSIDAGPNAAVFWTRETDPQWSGEKAIGFETLPDGDIHTYEINLRSAPEYMGVVTQLRLDPTEIAGTSIRIADVRALERPTFTRPADPTSLRVFPATGGGVALRWSDNAVNEEHIVIERAPADGDFSWLATLPPDTTAYNDATGDPNGDARYRVRAFNCAGYSQPGAEGTVTNERRSMFVIY